MSSSGQAKKVAELFHIIDSLKDEWNWRDDFFLRSGNKARPLPDVATCYRMGPVALLPLSATSFPRTSSQESPRGLLLLNCRSNRGIVGMGTAQNEAQKASQELA